MHIISCNFFVDKHDFQLRFHELEWKYESTFPHVTLTYFRILIQFYQYQYYYIPKTINFDVTKKWVMSFGSVHSNWLISMYSNPSKKNIYPRLSLEIEAGKETHELIIRNNFTIKLLNIASFTSSSKLEWIKMATLIIDRYRCTYT